VVARETEIRQCSRDRGTAVLACEDGPAEPMR
jgi:hypothetical protein